MTVSAATNRNLGLSKGQHRTVFRNPRGLKYYYSFQIADVVTSRVTAVRDDEGVAFLNESNAIDFGLVSGSGKVHSFDVKIAEDSGGSQLEIWVVAVGYDATDTEYQTKYVRGTIADASAALSWGAVQTIDANIETSLSDPHCIAVARTDNAEIVVAFTEDTTLKGKNYRLTKLIGSDGDGAAPSWSGETTLNDPSGNSNNQDKGEVWFGMDNFSSSYPNTFMITVRIPFSTGVATYACSSWEKTWNGAAFGGVGIKSHDTNHADAGKILSCLVDEEDYATVIYWKGSATAALQYYRSMSIGTLGSGTAVDITTDDCDACTETIDTGPIQDVPSSDEASGNWSPSAGGDLYAMVDEGYPESLTDYIDTLDTSDACRLGGFDGGLAPIVIVALSSNIGDDITISTYKSGVLVETLGTVSLISVAHSYAWWTTNSDWNEIRIVTAADISGTVRVHAVHSNPPLAYAFYHQSADSVDFSYKAIPLSIAGIGSSTEYDPSAEKIVSYHQDITALTSWNRVIENSLHIGGLYGTTVVYNEHPAYKALSTTLADMEFPDRNYYLGPHST